MDAVARRVASPNGTTEAGLAVLDGDSVLDELIAVTFEAAAQRDAEFAESGQTCRARLPVLGAEPEEGRQRMIGEIDEMEDTRLAFEPAVKRVPADERARLLADPGFGRVFTDHMALIEYDEHRGWHNARITAREPFVMDPASPVLHYAQEIFEGLKAYHRPGGGAALFRPQANARRFAKSAARMAMPPLPEEMFLDFRPRAGPRRPRMDPEDGRRVALFAALHDRQRCVPRDAAVDRVHLCGDRLVSGRPVPEDAASVSLWVTREYVRAALGGTGEAKCGGNYAGSLIAQAEAVRQGCDQVVFLDAVERRWVEELGGMNVFFVFDDGSVQTPPLDGTILHGITRIPADSGADMGLTVREERYSIEQWQADRPAAG